MTVAVTGASGHVGGNLVRALLAQGRHVRALVRLDTRALDGLDLELSQGDLTEPASLRRLFHGVETAFHLAAAITLRMDRGGIAQQVNVNGTRNVVEACLACGVRRLVHFSSIHAFSAYPLNETVTESRPLAEGSSLPAYDRTKVAAEKEILKGLAQGLDALIVNPTAIVGPFDFKPSAMGSVLLDLYHRRIPALVNGGFNWVDVRDVCAGALAAEQRGRTGDRYLLGGHYLSLAELASLAQEITGIPAPRLVAPLWLAHAGLPFAALATALTRKEPRFTKASLRALTHHQHVSHDKAARELEYRPRPFRQTLTDTYAWFRSAGHLAS